MGGILSFSCYVFFLASEAYAIVYMFYLYFLLFKK